MSSLGNFVKRFKNVYFESSCNDTPAWIAFSSSFKRALKKDFKSSEFVEMKGHVGHFYLDGFLKHINGKWIYFCFPDVRFMASGKKWYNDILYREAKDEKDYNGGVNHYCTLADLLTKADELARAETSR